MFLTPLDFKGKFELHTGMYVNDKIIEYIERYEKRYLIDLFGQKMYDEFINDIDPVTNAPKSPNFQKLFEPFIEDVTLYETINSEGVLDMLKGFIYFEYSKDNFNQQTVIGNVQQRGENSKVVNTLQTLIYNRYNEAVTTFRAIRDYIYLHYTEPMGQVVEISQTGNNGQTYVNANNVNTQFVGSGNVILINVSNIGTGYVTNTNVATSGGSGTGLTVDYTDDGAGGVLNATIINPGSGYVIGDVVTILNGNLDATLTIDDATALITGPGTGLTVDITANQIGGVDGYFLLTPGTGYTDGVYNLSNGTGSGFELSITANPIGGVLTQTLTAPGTGYVAGTGLTTTTLGAGSGCTVTITVDNTGAILSVTIDELGLNYSIGDVITIDGLNNDATFTVDSVTNGEINGVVEVINTGSGYTVNDVLTLNGGNLDATFEVLSTLNGEITEVLINQPGLNYSIGDVLTINGGDGLAEIEIIYVGVGNYGLYNGKQKQYAYWL